MDPFRINMRVNADKAVFCYIRGPQRRSGHPHSGEEGKQATYKS